MTDLYILVYVSTATHLMDEAELEALLSGAVEQNNKNGITGVLLYNDGDFMQCLEGPESAVRETFNRVEASRRHTGIICLYEEKISERSFSDWDMGYAKATKSQMLALSSARWKKVVDESAGAKKDSDGLMLLKDFWGRC
ncbi:MAG: BLUF domain-containing protein [Burkholderiales bacterium]|nr:BLUF domain-containing protein [Burkholderiales bacterium]